jgi:putative ABC transport system permease protein
MTSDRLLNLSERWFRLLLRLYPADFRDEMGLSVVETYRDRAREAMKRRGLPGLAGVWVHALVDTLHNGPGERVHPAVSWRRTGNWGRDAVLACRRLVRAPATAAALVATLMIGLGMFAVVSTVVQKILIEPMPYKDPDDLYFVWRDLRAYTDLSRGWLGGPDVAELQKAGGVIEGASGLLRQFRTFSLREGEEPAEIAVMVTSPNLFDLLGVQPAMGRGFAPGEVGPGRPPLIVLTHDFWNRLGADPAMLGASVRLNGQPFTVIGVLPPRFAFMRNASVGPPERADAYITFADITNLAEENPNAGVFAGVMRARRGTSPQVVAAAVAAVGRAVDARHFNGRGMKLYPVGLKPDLIAPIRPALVVVGFAGLFLLLALVVNLASVLLARAAQREHEFAVSRALGANSAAVVRATLFEGGLLGLAGGAAGALVATWAVRTLVALAPLDLPRREAVILDLRIAAVIVGVGVSLGLLAAIVPATWAARTSLSSLLANSGVRGGSGHGRTRRGLVMAQVALSLVLLTTGGLVVRSVERLLQADPGFRTEGVLTMRIPMPLAFARELKDVIALHDRIERALGAIPGVTAVSATSSLPLTANASQNTITIPGAPGLTGDRDRDSPVVDVIGVRANYVEIMGMRILAGRPFEPARREGVREALIDRHLARQFFPTGDPIGAKIPLGRDQTGRDLLWTIVGVVDHARQYGVHEDGRPQVYVRAEDGSRPFTWVLRSHGDPQSLIREARAAVRRTDSRLAVSEVRTMDAVVANAVRQQHVSAVMIASFALGALLLAAMGLFGVISGSVTRRAHEFAVRLALGADHGRVLRMVLGDGARLVAIGLLLGAPGSYFAGRIIRGVLVGVSPLDPLTLGVVAAGLALVALVACYLPARRVLALEPARSLRQ